MISTEPNKWDSDDAKILKDFLASSTGAIALQHVLYALPAFSDASPHATLVSSCLREGYQRAVQSLLDLQTIRPPQAEPEPNYPDLDRDELWNDSEELKDDKG
jgi:hypothetical protein